MTDSTATIASPDTRLERLAFFSLLGCAGALQLSIAAADILLFVTICLWTATLVRGGAKPAAPPILWPLLAYGGLTLLSAALSRDPRTSLIDCKQLVLYLIVPVTYQLAAGQRSRTMLQVIVSVGAASAAIGIIQYGVLHWNDLGQRPQGTMGHYMTYSGLLMLVTVLASSQILYDRHERLWPALVMPALLVAIALSFTRSAAVGVCAGVALLLIIKDFRLLAVLPLLAALFVGFAPTPVAERFYSMFDLHNETVQDRFAMIRTGIRIIRDEPFSGVGPNVVQEVYAQYRDPAAVKPIQPHLHNVPIQIAAERGLPALAAWVWFLVRLSIGMWPRLKRRPTRVFAAAALGSVAAMLAAGMFEYNFGDSEFLMMFLMIATLPFAAERPERRTATQ